MSNETVIITKIVIAMFKESIALRISKDIIPKEIEREMKTFLIKVFKVNTITDSKDIKKNDN